MLAMTKTLALGVLLWLVMLAECGASPLVLGVLTVTAQFRIQVPWRANVSIHPVESRCFKRGRFEDF